MSNYADLYPPAVRPITNRDRRAAQLRRSVALDHQDQATAPAVAAVRELLPRLSNRDRMGLMTDLSADTAGALQRALDRWGARLPAPLLRLLREAVRLERQRAADYYLS